MYEYYGKEMVVDFLFDSLESSELDWELEEMETSIDSILKSDCELVW